MAWLKPPQRNRFAPSADERPKMADRPSWPNRTSTTDSQRQLDDKLEVCSKCLFVLRPWLLQIHLTRQLEGFARWPPIPCNIFGFVCLKSEVFGDESRLPLANGPSRTTCSRRLRMAWYPCEMPHRGTIKAVKLLLSLTCTIRQQFHTKQADRVEIQIQMCSMFGLRSGGSALHTI